MVLVGIAFAWLGATASPAAHLGGASEPPIAAESVTTPVLASSSPDGRLKVVLVGGADSAAEDSGVGALIAREGDLVRWIRLPLAALPAALVVPDVDTLHCVGDSGELWTFSGSGALLGATHVAELLPELATRAEDVPIGLASDESGPCMAITLECGRVVLVHFDAGALERYQPCSIIRPARLACGSEAWLDQARALAREGDVNAALYAYEAAIESSPDDARCYRALASFHGRRGDHGAKFESLQMGMERLFVGARGPVTEEWRVGTLEARLAVEYVEAARETSNENQVEEALEEALGLYPCMAQAVFLRAEMLIDQGDLIGAVRVLDEAVARLEAGCTAPAHHDVGRFLRRKGLADESLRHLEEAYHMGERSEFLFRGISAIHEERGEFSEAAEWLEKLARSWRGIDNGASEPGRDARWSERLAELDAEVLRLWKRGQDRRSNSGG